MRVLLIIGLLAFAIAPATAEPVPDGPGCCWGPCHEGCDLWCCLDENCKQVPEKERPAGGGGLIERPLFAENPSGGGHGTGSGGEQGSWWCNDDATSCNRECLNADNACVQYCETAYPFGQNRFVCYYGCDNSLRTCFQSCSQDREDCENEGSPP